MKNMTACPNCGEENRKEALYCRKCGQKLQAGIYRKQKEPWGVVHIGVLLFSVLLLITAFGLVMGGTSLKSIQDLMTDQDGYIMSNTRRLQVPSYAIVVQDMDMQIDPMARRFFEQRGGFLEFKVITESNTPGKEIFVGVARYEDGFNYFDPMEYNVLEELNLDWRNIETGTGQTQYSIHQGTAPAGPPTLYSFWVMHGASEGSQTLTWEPEAGRYYLVLMNADGSAGIDTDVKIGVKVPFFGGLGNILLVVGLFVGGIGILLIYFTVKRNQP